jgi:hypothetical protein
MTADTLDKQYILGVSCLKEDNGLVIVTLTGSGPTWYLMSEKGFVVFTITNCATKEQALDIANKWATSWYNYRIKDGTDA